MYYYRVKDEVVKKYEVELHTETLKKLRNEIIEKCSYITHKKYTTTKTPNKWDYEHIRNYNENKIGEKDSNDFYSPFESEYLVEYDYYEHPKLISLIDALLKGNMSVIDEIKETKEEEIDKEKILLDEQRKIIEDLNKLDNDKINQQINLLTENQEKLSNCYEEKELNKNQVSANEYIYKTLSCIKFKEINSISLEKVLEVQEFFNSVSIKKELNKTLKLEKRKLNK